MAQTDPLTTTIQPQKHSELYWAISNCTVLITRSVKHIIKNWDQLLAVLFQPIMFMLLFRYVFGGAINTGGTSYVNFLVAGILVQNAAFGATYTAIGVSTDMQRGIIDRFKSLPMMTSAVLVGHTTADMVRNVISGVVMVLVGLAVGFRPEANVAEWLAVLGILLLFTFTMSWVSVIMGLLAKSVEAVQWMTFVVVFPITFASSAFVPTDGMPTGLRIFAENQPVTQVIDAIRALLVGTPIENHGWLSIIWLVGILVITMPIAALMFRRRSSS